MGFTEFFQSISSKDTLKAGGKGASLGEMTRAGIPVPPGFVVLSDAFERFIKEMELIAEIEAELDKVNHEEIHTVEKASEAIQGLIKSTPMPEDIGKEIIASFEKLGANFVAVRSSATAEDSSEAAWAGQLDTYLNTIKKDLLVNVQKCWASLFTPRAIFYRFEKGLHKEHVSVAVVVQKMVESKDSGIAFSVHPVTEDYNQLIIEAGFGLGESTVSGQITPDSYIVDKRDWSIIELNVNKQSKKLVKGKEGNDWIELNDDEGSKQVLTEKEITELSKLIVRIEKHYGFPVDIEWARDGKEFHIVQSRPITTLKKKKQDLKREVVVSHDSDLLTQDLILTGVYNHCDFTKFGLSFKFPLIKYQHSTGDVSYPKEQVEELRNLDISVFTYKKLIKFIEKELINYRNFLKKFEKALSNKQLNKDVIRHFFIISEKAASSVPYFAIEMSLYKHIENSGIDASQIPSTVTYTINATLELQRIKEKFVEELDQNKIPEELFNELQKFCDEYGYLGMKYFKGKPWNVEDAKDMLMSVQSLKPNKKRVEIDNLHVKIASQLLKLRTKKYEYMCKGTFLFRKLIEKYYPKINYDDLLNLRIEDVMKITSQRQDTSEFEPASDNFALEITESGLKYYEEYVPQDISYESEQVFGTTAYPGKVQGCVKVILKPSESSKFNIGDILVTKMSTPDFLPVIQKASAIITDIGGITSHAAIISRELKKPCIIGTKFATKALKDGDLIEVDADEGTVRKISKIDINLNEWDFEFQQRDEHCLLMADQWCKAVYNKLPAEINLELPGLDYMFTSKSKGYVKKLQKKALLKKYQSAVNDQKYLNYIFRTAMYRAEELNKFSAYACKKLESANKNELVTLWDEFNNLFACLIPWFYIAWYLTEEDILVNKVRQGLEKYRKEIEAITDFNNALAIITFPVKEVMFQKEQSDLYELTKLAISTKKYTENNLFKKRAEEYLKNYSWMKTFVILPREPLTYKELLGRISESISSNFVETYELQVKNKEKNHKLAEQMLNVVKESKNLVKDIENARELAWLLTAHVEKSLHALAGLKPFYKKISEILKIPHEDWIYLTIDEIREYLNEKEFDSKTIKQRKISFVYVMEKGKSTIISGEKAKEKIRLIDENLNKIDENITKLSGQPAYPGKVVGKAHIILKAKNAHKLKKGEVLICAMTSPDYVPAMKRAEAIVTNEGGLLCHAAIISRELCKPCIVGTKYSTKFLKDGDLVEIDANKGIVRKLST